jgi:hypothetical protein
MPSLQKLIGAYREWAFAEAPNPDIPRVQVDHVIARVAAFYEKIRGIVGWTEEHLLRKAAIIRILRRSMLIANGEQQIADTLVKDLVRGGYFPNAAIPETNVAGLGNIIGKYLFLLERTRSRPLRERRVFENWLFTIAGSEVEAFLDPPIREEALLEFMTQDLERRVSSVQSIPEKERENLLFIAVRQALLKLDEPVITYQLLKKYLPGWDTFTVLRDREKLEQFASQMGRWYRSIRRAFTHSSLRRFYFAAEALDAPYLILGDLLSELAKSGALVSGDLPSGEELEALIFTKYRERLRQEQRKAMRAAIYSTISIFITKVLLAFAVELPIDRLTGQFSESTLLFNIAIPPILMMVIVLFGFRRPRRRDVEKSVEEIKRILAGDPRPYHIRLKESRSLLIRGVVGLLYAGGAAATFGVIIYFLTQLHFSPLSQGIFIFFVSLISYAGLRIRERSKELLVEEKPPGLLHDFFLFFTFPIVELGRALSDTLLKIRLVALLLDALIELPLKFFLEFLEQWRAFLREKKQDIRQ